VIRGPLVANAFGGDTQFRWRGHEVSRLEGFSDAVFAFALTLLVVALEVPKTYAELIDTMRGFLAFGVCFLVLYKLWWSHYTFFRRYGLSDTFVIAWNAVLLFLVLFFIYPMKFLFTALFDLFFLKLGLVSGETRDRVEASCRLAFENADGRTLMVIYGAGFLLVSVVFAVLYRHALARADELELDELERHLTVDEIQGHWIDAAVAASSITIVSIGGSEWAGVAGWWYAVLGPLRAWHGWKRSKSLPKRVAAA
jgi:hypothetical protein